MLNIDELISNAIKEKDYISTRVFRSIKAEIIKFKTAKNAKPYSEEAEIALLKKLKNQHEESIKSFQLGNREDLAQAEEVELSIIKSLIPNPVDIEEIEVELQCMLEDEGLEVVPKQKMGYFINTLKKLFPYNDAKDLSTLVKSYIV